MTRSIDCSKLALLPLLFSLGACNSAEKPTDEMAAAGSSTGGSSTTTTSTAKASGGNAPTSSIAQTGGTTPQATTGSTGGFTQQSGATLPIARGELVPDSLQAALVTAKNVTGQTLLTTYPTPATTTLPYEAKTATGMSLIQASGLALNDSELAVLAQNGLVISKRQQFPSFAYGYKNIYYQDLPVYVSADSILEAVHRTFDTLLKNTEELVLIGELTQMLTGMRARLGVSALPTETTKDCDLYLTLATSLLSGKFEAPTAGADATLAKTLFDLATAATGTSDVTLFGVSRTEDFSQFEPRGHYTDSPALSRYFRAMMWLGRVDLRIIETKGDGTQVFFRRQFDAAVALRELLGQAEYKLWEHIDGTIGAYVGEHDSMTPKALDGLMTALNVTSLASSTALTDQQIIDEIARGGWGSQRIASRIIIKEPNANGTLPLDRSFLIFGQRYTVDSHAFVNTTYDRVEGRMMPNPLDAAFAALGNNAALPLLTNDFSYAGYAQGLAKTRTLVDAHEAAYWEGSLYTRWLGALRSLSPVPNAVLPSIAETPAWQKRILSTQLGSWAELRHDTILYAKQSYTTGVSCEFPDAYVDPYPELYAKLGAFADAVGVVTAELPSSAASLKTTTQAWVTNFKTVATNLQKMAENQVAGTPHSAELLTFINDAVKWDESMMCGGKTYSNLAGWYLKLYLNNTAGIEFDPTVADVHTQPTDEFGNEVGKVLHVGTGHPRLMVVTVDTCNGPRAYAGLAFSYGERITEKWLRLNDKKWETDITTSPFPDVPWMSSLLSE